MLISLRLVEKYKPVFVENEKQWWEVIHDIQVAGLDKVTERVACQDVSWKTHETTLPDISHERIWKKPDSNEIVQTSYSCSFKTDEICLQSFKTTTWFFDPYAMIIPNWTWATAIEFWYWRFMG